MSKVLIELKEGSFLDYFGGNQYISSFRPQVVENTTAVQGLVASGKATLISKLRDDAEDAVYADAYAKAGKNANVAKVNEAFLKSWDEKGKGAAAPVAPAGNGNGNGGTNGNGNA